MKQYFKDYGKYYKDATALAKVFYKKHWKGTVVLYILVLVVEFAWIFRDSIKEKITGLNYKGLEEEA